MASESAPHRRTTIVGVGLLLLITGPPGAGKSTVARRVAAQFEPSVLVEGDAFFAFLDQGAVAPWLREADGQNQVVTRAAAAATGRFASGGYATIYDGVVGPWFLPTFLEAAGVDGLHYAVLLPTVERCVERVAARVGHGFTDEPATRKMHHEFATAGVGDRHLVSDWGDDVDAVVDGVLGRLREGSLLYR